MFRLTVTYAGAADARFDFDYYTSTHMQLVREKLGSNVTRIEVGRGIAGADGPPAPYVATSQIWLTDIDAFGAAMSEHGGSIMGDVANFTDLAPVIQVEELLTVKVPELV